MKLTKLLSLLLALAMVFALVGCGSTSDKDDDDEDDKKDSVSTSQKADEDEDKEEGIVGTWVAKVDLVELMEASGEEIPDDVKDLDGYLEMTFEFKDNGKVELSLDTGNFGDALKDLMDAMLVSQLEEMYGMTLEEVEEEAGKSIDEILEEELGMTFDDYVETAVEALEESFKELEEESEYEFDGKELTIDGEEIDFELDGDNLTIEIPDFGKVEFERD